MEIFRQALDLLFGMFFCNGFKIIESVFSRLER
jgi:hypothetical protein